MASPVSMPAVRPKAFTWVLMADAALRPDAACVVTREQSGPAMIESFSDARWRESYRSALISHTLVHGRIPCWRRLVIRRQPLRHKGCRHIPAQLAQTPRATIRGAYGCLSWCMAGIAEGQAIRSPSSPLRVVIKCVYFDHASQRLRS